MVENVNEVVVLTMNITTHTEGILLSLGKLELDDIRKGTKIADGLDENDIYKLDVDLVVFLMPLQHVQNETLSDNVIVHTTSIILIVDRRSLNLRREA